MRGSYVRTMLVAHHHTQLPSGRAQMSALDPITPPKATLSGAPVEVRVAQDSQLWGRVQTMSYSRAKTRRGRGGRERETQAFRFLKTRAANSPTGKNNLYYRLPQPEERNYSKCRNETQKEKSGRCSLQALAQVVGFPGLPTPSARSCSPSATRSVRFARAHGRG